MPNDIVEKTIDYSKIGMCGTQTIMFCTQCTIPLLYDISNSPDILCNPCNKVMLEIKKCDYFNPFEEE